jgi:hypothetical protein
MKHFLSVKFLLIGIALTIIAHDSRAGLSTLSSLPLRGIAKNVHMKGPIAFVSTDSGLAAIDVGNPKNPVLKNFLKLPGKGNELSLFGNLAFVTDGGAKAAQIVDISKPESLHIIGSMGDSCGYVWGIDSKKIDNSGHCIVGIASLTGLTMFQSDSMGQSGLLSRYLPYWGIGNPGDSLSYCDSCSGFNRWIKTDDIVLDSVFGYILYYDIDHDGSQQLCLKKMSLTDPSKPRCVDSLELHTYGCGLEVANGVAYVVYSGNLKLGFHPGMDIIDVKSSPMVKKSSTILPGPAEDIAIEGSLAYIACAGEGVRVFNVSNPTSPVVIDSFPLTVFSFPVATYGIALGDTTIYAAMGERGLWIFSKPKSTVRTRTPSVNMDNSRFVVTVNNTSFRIKSPCPLGPIISTGLYTLSGKLLFQRPIVRTTNGEAIVNIANRLNGPMKAGVYLLRLQAEDGAIVVERPLIIAR